MGDTRRHVWVTPRFLKWINPDSKVYGANMEPIWGRQDPGGPHVGPMNLAIWEDLSYVVLFVEEWHIIHLFKCYTF